VFAKIMFIALFCSTSYDDACFAVRPECQTGLAYSMIGRITVQYNTMINLYSAIIRNAETLGGKNVSHDAAKKVSFQSLFKSC